MIFVFLEDIEALWELALWRNIHHSIGGDIREIVEARKQLEEPILVKIEKLTIALQICLTIQR
jgi:hypothetical protein